MIHPFSYPFIPFHPLSSPFITFHPLSSPFIPFIPFHPLSSIYKNLLLNAKVPRIQSCKKDRVCSKKHIPIVGAVVGTSRLIMANNWLSQRNYSETFNTFLK